MDTGSFGTGVRTEGIGAIDRFLLHRRLPWLLAGLAILLTLPSLWAGRLADDFHHQLRLARSEEFYAMYPELPVKRFGLVDFADGNPDRTRTLMESQSEDARPKRVFD